MTKSITKNKKMKRAGKKDVKKLVKQYQTENEDILLAIEAMRTSQLNRDVHIRHKQKTYRVILT